MNKECPSVTNQGLSKAIFRFPASIFRFPVSSLKPQSPSLFSKWRNVAVMLAVTVLTIFFNLNAQAAAFTAGNVVVLQYGDGSVALSSAAAPEFALEYLPSTASQSSPQQTITIPATGASRLTGVGSSVEGFFTRSTDGTIVTFAGYDADSATASLAGTSASTVNRIVGKLDSSATFTRTASGSTTAFSGSNVRSAVSDGTSYWIAGTASTAANGGTWYSASGGTPSEIVTAGGNFRVARIFNGTLYYSTGSGTVGIYAFSGIPTTSATASIIITSDGTSPSPYDFAINPAGTVAYVADDRTLANGGGVQKWTFNGSSWSRKFTFGTANGLSLGCRALAVDFSGANPVIYTTDSASSANKLTKITDTSAFAATSDSTDQATTLATAGSNKAFRGVALAPVAIPSAPTANAGSSVTSSGFTANWSAVSGATSYQLDVSTLNTFASFVSGYQNLPVSGTSQAVSGLSASTTYYYRVRAVNSAGSASANSGTITVNTPSAGTPAITVTLPNQSAANTGTPIAQTAGTAFGITVTATTDGTTVNSSYTGTHIINLSTSTGSPISPSSVSLTFTNGVTAAMFTLTKAENVTITATDNTIAGTASSPLLVNPGAIAAYTVTASSPQNAGVAFPVTVTAYDAYGNVATNRSATITMSSSSGTVTFDNNPVNLNIASGTVIVNATDSAADSSMTITATDGNNINGTTGNIAVNYLLQYRSQTSGNWNAPGTWQVSSDNGNNWTTATATPTSADGTVEIQSGNTVTVSAPVTVDQVTVDSGGAVTVATGVTLTVANGTGTDLDISGTVEVVGTGILSISSGAAMVVESGGILKDSQTTSSAAIVTTGTLTVSFGGKFQLNVTTAFGTIPTATWSFGSTCEIIGYTSDTGFPNGINQVFYNFTWNCPNQTANIFLNTTTLGNLTTINGSFTVLTTGTGSLVFDSSVSSTLSIGINLIISGGTLNLVSSTASPVINVAGNLVVNGGTLNLSTGTGAGTVNVSGSAVVTSGAIKGAGTVNDATTMGGTLSPGNSSIATITFGSSLTLAFTGMTPMDIKKSGSTLTADKVAVTTALTYGGTLTINESGDALAAGDSFTLFTAATFSSYFSSVSLPGLTAGLTWDTNGLATAGVLSVYAFTTASSETMTANTNATTKLLIAKVLSKTSGGRGTLTLLSTNGGTGTITSDGTYLYYTPASGAASDSFNCVVQDTNGATTTVVVNVTVVDPSNTGNGSNLTIVDNMDGTVRIVVSGVSGVTYQLQFSSDMTTWNNVGSAFVMPSVGLMNFTEMTAFNSGFYRTVLPSSP